MWFLCAPPTPTLVILSLENFSLLANTNKALPIFVRQHMLWLKINPFNILTMLDCCLIGLLFHFIEEKYFVSFHTSPVSWLAVQPAGEAFSWSVRRKNSKLAVIYCFLSFCC